MRALVKKGDGKGAFELAWEIEPPVLIATNHQISGRKMICLVPRLLEFSGELSSIRDLAVHHETDRARLIKTKLVPSYPQLHVFVEVGMHDTIVATLLYIQG
jgi:hypothetical protein